MGQLLKAITVFLAATQLVVAVNAQEAGYPRKLASVPEELTPEDVYAYLWDQKVVTVSRREQKISEAPASVTIITAEDIKRSGATNLPELLKSIPGIDVLTIYGGISMISARGMQPYNSWKIAILIDGQLLEPSFYGTLSWNQLPILLDDIERIEVIKSPGILYGANSLKGVVNVITKSPKTSGSRISGITGQYNTNIFSLSQSHSFNRASYRISIEEFKTDDWTKFRQPGTSKAFERVADKHLTINTLFNFYPNESSDIKFTFANNDYNFWNRIPDRLCETRMEGDFQYGKISYSKNISEKSNLKMDMGHDFSTFQLMENGSNITIRPKLQKSIHSLALQYSAHINSKNIFLSGFEYKLESTKDKGEVTIMKEKLNENIEAGYLNYEHKIYRNLTAHGDFRFDRHYITGSKLAPSASIVFNPSTKHVFKISATHAYRSPNVFESKMDYSQTTGTSSKRGRYMGNDKLKAESINSFMLSYQSLLFAKFQNMVNLFFDKTKNSIENYHVRNELINGQTLPVLQFLNAGTSNTKGIELETAFSATKRLNVNFGYTYQMVNNKGAIVKHPNGRWGDQFAPKHKFTTTFNYDIFKGLHARLFYNFVNHTLWERPVWSSSSGTESIELLPVKDYHLWDLGITYHPYNAPVNISLTAFDLFDNRVSEWWDGHGGTISRKLVGKVTYQF